MKSQEKQKKQAAMAALDHIEPGMTVGVGTGSTAAYFIEELAKIKGQINSTVASSEATAKLLRAHHIPVLELTAANPVDVYVDGADEFTAHRHLIKGGGGALTREKILAAAAKRFICIVDESKKVDVLGAFPLPIEVIPMARSLVARQLVKLGGSPEYRADFITDNGNIILDTYNLSILNPIELEQQLNQITGVVTNGLFACRPADHVLMATSTDIITF